MGQPDGREAAGLCLGHDPEIVAAHAHCCCWRCVPMATWSSSSRASCGAKQRRRWSGGDVGSEPDPVYAFLVAVLAIVQRRKPVNAVSKARPPPPGFGPGFLYLVSLPPLALRCPGGGQFTMGAVNNGDFALHPSSAFLLAVALRVGQASCIGVDSRSLNASY